MIMEASRLMSIAFSLACILVVTLLWGVFKWVWLNPKRLERILRDQGFQGNPYKLLFGDTREQERMIMEARSSKPMVIESNDIHPRARPFQHHSVRTYGNKFFMWMGPTPVINISEPKIMRDIFEKIHEFQKFQRKNPIVEIVVPGLFQLEGQVWAHRRKLVNPAFHIEKLKFMIPAILASCSDMINTWERLMSETGSHEVDVWPYLKELSADIISRSAFGSSYEEGRRIFELIIEQMEFLVPMMRTMYIPGWRFVPTKANRRLMQLNREIKYLLREIINKREKAIEAGEKPKDDLLGLLLESSSKDFGHDNNGKKSKIGLKIGEVIDECKTFYFAGQESTSSLIVWTLIMLSKHQDWQHRAREEVLNAFGSNATFDFHGLNHLKTVNMILQEVLRLYSPVIELYRTVLEDVKVGDIVIPAGVTVLLPLLQVQHDEKIWGADAKEFNPGRFSEGISKASGGNMSYFAFGWGPRICIGSNFSMIEARLALVSILQRFSLEISPAYAHAPASMTTLQPQFGAPIILKRLSL